MRIDADTRALVTGASKGIGRALASALAERGATVGLLARSQGELEGLAAELPGEHVALPADVGDRRELERAVETFVEEAGGLDLLVANAGIAHYGPFIDSEPGQIEAMVRVNVLGSIQTVAAALPVMLERGAGHIVVVSSGAGLRAFPAAAVYGATKAANRGFAEALRHELAGTGIGLTTVFPGEVATELHAHERERMPAWRQEDREIDPGGVAERVIAAVEADARAVYAPRIVRLLGLNGIAPGFVDRMLRAIRGKTAAPRKG